MNKRLEKVIERMKDRGLSQLLISDPGSIYYLTGISVDPGERFFGLIVRESGETSLIVNRLFSVPKTDIKTVWLGDTDSVSEAVARLIDRKAELGVDKLLPARFLIPIRDKLEGGKTVDEAGAVGFADDDMSFTRDVIGGRGTDSSLMVAYATFPAATIDVTGRTAFDIGIGTGNEIIIEIILVNLVFVVYRTYCSCGIEVLGHRTAQ